ncbi:MAG: hypothetical protein ABI650_04180, partial [Dokdonella sp.]
DRATMQRKLDDIEARVIGLLDFWEKSQQQPQWYFPSTSWIAVGGDSKAATAKWAGSHETTGERDYSNGYARLLAGERDFSDQHEYASLHDNATRLLDLISLTLTAERAA